jgi:hypothetical protein
MDIDNNQDVLDSRDINKRLEELEDAYSDWKKEQEREFGKWQEDSPNDPVSDSDFEDWDELVSLRDLVEQCKDGGDWEYGESLIRDTYFTDYCHDMVEDIGDLPKDLPFYIENNIDWDGVAEDLKADYTEVDFDGVTYFLRA